MFLVEIAILCWMKFYTISHEAAWVATGLLIPIFIIFIAFAAMFYLKLVSHKSEVKTSLGWTVSLNVAHLSLGSKLAKVESLLFEPSTVVI